MGQFLKLGWSCYILLLLAVQDHSFFTATPQMGVSACSSYTSKYVQNRCCSSWIFRWRIIFLSTRNGDLTGCPFSDWNLVLNCHHKPVVVGGCHLRGDLQLWSHLEQVLLALCILPGACRQCSSFPRSPGVAGGRPLSASCAWGTWVGGLSLGFLYVLMRQTLQFLTPSDQ